MTEKRSPREVLTRVYARAEKDSLIAAVAVAGEPHIVRGGKVELQIVRGDTAGIEGQIAGSQTPVLRRTIRRLLPAGRTEVSFPLAKIPLGDWCIRAVFTDRHGRRCPTRVVQHRLADRPEWFGSAEGTSRTVPPPWTPLRSAARRGGFSVACWGRTYEFDRDSCIRQILSDGIRLLAGPIRWVGKINGRKLGRLRGSLHCLERARDRVVLSQELTGNGVTLDVQLEMEFDGMLRVDCELSARKPAQVQALALEIPLRAEIATHFYQYRGRVGDDRAFGRVPARGFSKGFRPFVWLGNEERGLSWFAESEENWFHADSSRAITLRRERNAVVLRLHLVSTPVDVVASDGADWPYSDRKPPLVRRLRYAFGLQATPVKPVEKDAWDHRIFCVAIDPAIAVPGKHSLDIPLAELDRLAEAGVRTIVMFESWTDIEAHARTTHGRKLRRLVRACHERGMKILLYFGFLFSELAPEWRDFGARCVVLPRTGWSLLHFPPQPIQPAWRVCLRSAWQDFLVDGIARVMDEYDIDGVYLDGTAQSYACRNALHGCGVVRKDGSIGPTFPIFSVRSAMRRIYSAVRSRKPDGQVNVHNSTCMTIPTLAWATSTWDGEQFAGLKRGADASQFLPLDSFRVEFMGHQWGVPAEFLCYGKPLTYKEAWALSLLHDVPVRAHGRKGDLDLLSAIWKVMDGFGRKEAQWVPYWRNADFVKTSPTGVQASLYIHPRNGVLAVVSNLTSKSAVANLRFDPSRPALPQSEAVARDALTQELLRMHDGVVRFRLRSLEWRLVWVAG